MYILMIQMEPTSKWSILYSLSLSSMNKQRGCLKEYDSLKNEDTLEN
jgi:hypothetical protein